MNTIRNTSPWIARDIEKHKICKPDAIINHFLSRCILPNAQDLPESLLQSTLEAVLPIGNELIFDIKHLHNVLTNAAPGDVHKLTVKILNKALFLLRDVSFPWFRPAGNNTPMFHRNKCEDTPHKCSSTHMPSVVLVERNAALKVHNLSQDSEVDYKALLKLTYEEPTVSFNWLQIKGTVVSDKNETIHEHFVPSEYGESSFTLKHQEAQKFPKKWERGGEASWEKYLLKGGKSYCRMDEDPNRTPKPEAAQTSSEEPPSPTLEEEDYCNPPPIIQAGIYAAERLSATVGHKHAINLLFRGEVVHVWWYDRQGVIQSEGINVITNLPHFLALLVAFQRFSGDDWGVIPTLVPPDDGDYQITLNTDAGHEVTLKLNRNIHTYPFSIVGLANSLMFATSTSPDPRDTSKSLDSLVLAVKLTWSEKWRRSEKDILEKAHEIAKIEPGITDHIPELIVSCDFESRGGTTETIRTALGLVDKNTKHGTRVLRLEVFPALWPVAELSGDQCFKAIWDCFCCHYTLWKHGIHHRNINPSCIRYDDQKDGTIRGVLTNFDFASLEEDPHPFETHPYLETVPFMSLDLMSSLGLSDSTVAHQYVHDAESFIWSFLFITHCYDPSNYNHGEEDPVQEPEGPSHSPSTPPISNTEFFAKWMKATPFWSQGNKMICEEELVSYAPTPAHEANFKDAVLPLLMMLSMARSHRMMLPKDGKEPEPAVLFAYIKEVLAKRLADVGLIEGSEDKELEPPIKVALEYADRLYRKEH
ncbi:hypothetical protein C8Q75DRAFT_415091 [Abortiporus biennis]|nr:hypothetical protein C8Q75DRAFT_415091 [Abortiporus biennis]